ncbi:MAG: sortase [Thermoleophilaceae bacterium]
MSAGQRITVDMPGRRYVYRVERTEIVEDSDVSVLDPVGHRRLLLSACHPLYSAEQRIIAYARQVGTQPARVSTADSSRDSRKRSGRRPAPARRRPRRASRGSSQALASLQIVPQLA